MGRYRSSGGLDDPVVEDGDGRFVGMNQRLHPSQLGPGEVRLSRNGRIDGYWIPRRGVDVVSSVLDTSGTPLRLPFWLVDTSGGADITAASLTSDVVSLTVVGHGIPRTTAILDPAGTNNAILLTRVGATPDGQDITVEIVAPSDSTSVSVTTSGSDVVVTPGGKAQMVVTGVVTSGVNGTLSYAGTYMDGLVLRYAWTSDGLPYDPDIWGVTPSGRAAVHGNPSVGWTLEDDRDILDFSKYSATVIPAAGPPGPGRPPCDRGRVGSKWRSRATPP